jgi:exosortase
MSNNKNMAVQVAPDNFSDRFLLLHLMPSFVALTWLSAKASWFWNHQPDLSFGWIVVFLCAFLFWESWQVRPAATLKVSWVSVLCGMIGIGLLFVFQIYQAALGLKPAALVGLAMAVMLVVSANLHYVFGWKGLLKFLFPYAFILIALPMPSAVHGIVVNGLQHQVAYLTVEILAVIGIPADLAGSVIHLSSGPVGVDEACSGIRSLQSTIMATLFIGFLMLKGLGLRILLFFAGIFLAVFGNLMRVLFLSYQAHHHGIEAVDANHDAAGWSILLFTVGGVAVLSWLLGKLQLAIERLPKPDQAPS